MQAEIECEKSSKQFALILFIRSSLRLATARRGIMEGSRLESTGARVIDVPISLKPRMKRESGGNSGEIV